MKIYCWNTKSGKQASQIHLDMNKFGRMGENGKNSTNFGGLKRRLSHADKK